MKNSLFILLLFLLPQFVFAENINIQAKNISINKDKEISIFRDNVSIQDNEFNSIKSNFAEYNKKEKYLLIKGNIEAIDKYENILTAQEIEYDLNKKILKSKGRALIITKDGYKIQTENIILDKINKLIKSNFETLINDNDNNEIYLKNFEYLNEKNIIKSVGYIKISDRKKNNYELSQIYIDQSKKEIIGTDIKAFLNSEDFKVNKKNKPRIFANTFEIKNKKTKFKKSIFTVCDYREKDKCPPWTLQSSEILHDNEKKTLFYKNALLKIYDIPIFYLPTLSHPDPTVDRRSGFLMPGFTDTRNLGSSVSIPYYFAFNKDKDFTLTNRIFLSEHPLFLGEYRQAFKNSNLILDMGYTDGYKNISSTKKAGKKEHFFSKFTKNFIGKNGSQNSLDISLQNTNNKKYLKLYKIDTILADHNKDILENSINFSHQNVDLFFGFNSSIYESLKDNYNDKYEFILPDITLDKNLMSNNFGNLNLQSNFQIHNYDTNKTNKFLVNDFIWDIYEQNFQNGLNSKLIANIKNSNYETNNIPEYKDETTSDLFGAIGYLAELNLFKETQKGFRHFFTPKILARFSPDYMKKENDGSKLNILNVFELNRLDSKNNFEGGFNATLGFDYSLNNQNDEEKFNFSLAQIVNNKENKNMPSKTSLDEKLSDLVGSANLNITDNFKFNYNFLIDENYNDLNYGELSANYSNNLVKFNIDYLKEDNHIGNQNYIKTGLNFYPRDNTSLSFKNKRNLVNNSSEYYDLSYEYFNDCLRAGIVYRREFYNDSEIEPENSLMFKITIVPFGNIDTPSFNN